MNQPKIILDIIKVIHDKLEIALEKDKILTISIENPLVQIRGMVPEVKAIHNKVRTSKNGENERTLRQLYAQSPTLLRGRDSNAQPTP